MPHFWESTEFWKAVAPICAALIAVCGVIYSNKMSRRQFLAGERRIEDHFVRLAAAATNNDAIKARLELRLSELSRINDEVELAAKAVETLAKSVTSDNSDTEIVKRTAIAFQDVAPLFQTMSTIKDSWLIKEEVATLEQFESALTTFFIRLHFEAPEEPEEKRKYHSGLKEISKEVITAKQRPLALLKSNWEASSM
ncbi:MAG TPA: hypothetical protein VJ734_09415 [Nitrosospira sp.]|nr:hypothetical protein [Nitrosospira sp.]